VPEQCILNVPDLRRQQRQLDVNQQLGQVLLPVGHVVLGPQNESVEHHLLIHHIQIVICKQLNNFIGRHCNKLLIVHHIDEMLLKTTYNLDKLKPVILQSN